MANNTDEVDRRIEALESKAEKMEEKVFQLDKNISIYSVIFEKNLQIQEKLSASIDRLTETTAGLKGTMIELQNESKRNAETQADNVRKISKIEEQTELKVDAIEKELQKKLEGLSKEIDKVEDFGKFDFLKYIRKNFIAILFFIFIVVEQVQEYLIKTGGK